MCNQDGDCCLVKAAFSLRRWDVYKRTHLWSHGDDFNMLLLDLWGRLPTPLTQTNDLVLVGHQDLKLPPSNWVLFTLLNTFISATTQRQLKPQHSTVFPFFYWMVSLVTADSGCCRPDHAAHLADIQALITAQKRKHELTVSTHFRDLLGAVPTGTSASPCV